MQKALTISANAFLLVRKATWLGIYKVKSDVGNIDSVILAVQVFVLQPVGVVSPVASQLSFSALALFVNLTLFSLTVL
jgi:hypothetical protein